MFQNVVESVVEVEEEDLKDQLLDDEDVAERIGVDGSARLLHERKPRSDMVELFSIEGTGLSTSRCGFVCADGKGEGTTPKDGRTRNSTFDGSNQVQSHLPFRRNNSFF